LDFGFDVDMTGDHQVWTREATLELAQTRWSAYGRGFDVKHSIAAGTNSCNTTRNIGRNYGFRAIFTHIWLVAKAPQCFRWRGDCVTNRPAYSLADPVRRDFVTRHEGQNGGTPL
jgi:hypothetical protein